MPARAPNTADRDGSPDSVLEPDAAEPAAPARRWWKTPLIVLGLVAVAAVMVYALRGKVPTPATVWTAIQEADWWWIVLAAAVMVISVVSFALQQRVLLQAFDTAISWRRIVAITYACAAMTNALPAGAAVAAGFNFRQYRLAGANRSTAATVMVLSGLLSVGSLAALYFLVLGTATATSFVALLKAHPGWALLIAVVVLALGWLLVARWRRGVPDQLPDAPTPRLDRWEQRWPRLTALLRDGRETLNQARLVKVRYLSEATGWTLLKWGAEAGCLLACCWAFGLSVPLLALSVMYLGIQFVRQVPLTPGGVGLVEASLLTGLVSVGAPGGPAAAAVLIYRVLSAWGLIPLGFALLAEMKRRDARRAAAATASEYDI